MFSKIQSLASITEAMGSTPTKALDAILNLLLLHEYVQLEAEKVLVRLKRVEKFMPGDVPYKLRETTRADWGAGGPTVHHGLIKSHTDGSKVVIKTAAGILT